MANLQELQNFAEDREHRFGLTSPLLHKQVESLAKHWLPQIFFFEKEKFHPIALEQTNDMIKAVFDNPEFPESTKDVWRVNLFVRTGEDTGENRKFDPPVVHVPDGFIPGSPFPVLVVRVLNSDGVSFEEALEDPKADTHAVVTHGASFARSDQFFGAKETVFGGAVGSPGDPLRPRAEEDGAPLMTVYASFKNLLDTVKYELAVAEKPDYPPDALRRGFDVVPLLFSQVSQEPSAFTLEERRDFIQALIAAHEANESIQEILQGLPSGWRFNIDAWRALTRYAFLEYEFFYAYNDFERVQTTFFDNQHEGDNEGCCLVFDRRLINLAATSDDPDNPKLLLKVVPESIITSVHEEWQDADVFKQIPQIDALPDDPEELKKLVNLAVYVAWGSHATYLTPGDHPLVDFQDMTTFIGDNIPLPLILADPGSILATLILMMIIEHFDDPQDVTSEDGIRSVPEGTTGENPLEDPLTVETRIVTLPMTEEDHIYKPDPPEYRELLRLRSFAGKWGGHNGFINHSPQYETKTGRYFRKLLKNL